MYKNEGGKLYNLNYARPSSLAADPVEKKPLYHFYPATEVFSMGSWGCNFSCRDCQNWEISATCEPTKFAGTGQVLPNQAVRLANQYQCQGIAWTYNEPTIWFEYTLETARIAKQNGLYTVYVTNGYMTTQALDEIGPYLDAWRVDLKGFSNDFYQKWCGISNWKGILATAKRARQHWGMHIEVVTNIIPSLNDDVTQLKGIANWIASHLGELTPWHVTRFYPYQYMAGKGCTPLETLVKATEIGHAAGLKFVYIGNVSGSQQQNTVCFNCSRTVVERNGYQVRISGLEGAKCRYCGTDLNFRLGKGGE
jgi:pyruvate formate lyase activating enzyme